MIRRVRGTRDILDFKEYLEALAKIEKVLEQHGYERVDLPILERRELFERSLGSATDVVEKEMFHVVEDEDACLRPEGTAGAVRAFFENSVNSRPWKIFLFGKMFRHERPQKGRYREFYQLSIERIGSEDPVDDAAFIVLLDKIFGEVFGISGYELKVNFIGCAEDRKKYGEALRTFVYERENEFCEDCRRRVETNPLRVLDCKREGCRNALRSAPKIEDFLCDTCRKEKERFFNALQFLGVSQYTVDERLVRGLDYYSGAVFEFISGALGAQNAFCGGGRYDLSSIFSDRMKLPSIGAAIGMDRLVMILKEEGKLSGSVARNRPIVLIPISEAEENYLLLVMRRLLAQGMNVEFLAPVRSLRANFKKADKMAATHAILAGENEVEQLSVLIRNLSTGEERLVKQEELLFNPKYIYEV